MASVLKIASGIGIVAGIGGLLMLPKQATVTEEMGTSSAKVERMDLSSFSDQKPSKPVRLLFLHHSIGGALLAKPGAEEARARCIWKTHPQGGDGRALLEAQGYEVHEASYGSELGEETDLFDWPQKFRNKADRILKCDHNDQFYSDGKKNEVIVFKSCYPNSRFIGEGTAPGNPTGPELTVWNAKAALSALLEEFKKHPDTLFVYVTAPPLAPKPYQEPTWKWLVKKAMGKPDPATVLTKQGQLARQFNSWVVSKDGWLRDYPLKNVAVFDYYDVLTDQGASNLSRYASEGGTDSHPTAQGNAKAAPLLVTLLNRSVRRAGLSD